jgi:hypothetical protein
VRACEQIREAMARIDPAADHPLHLNAELLREQLNYWERWRRILEDQRP